MDIPLLNDTVIIFGLAIVVLLICHKLRIPEVVGFLLTGIFVGPYGFGLVKAIHEVELLAEIGIVLLLFTIGIEFSLKRLMQIKKAVLMGGSLQVALTFLATVLAATWFDLALNQSIFIGFLVALSSTAIVLKLIQKRAEVDSPHGRTTLGVLIFQDIIIVPMILITPMLAGVTGDSGATVLVLLAKAFGIILLVIVSTKWLVPWVLFQVAKTRSQEIFLLSLVVICLGVAWLTSEAGLSLALGAFLAGLIISESEYSHQALGNIIPFRDIFTSFFFVSIGMLLDVGFLFQNPIIIVLLTLSVLALKFTLTSISIMLLGLPFRASILVGLALSQVGEFSFILSRSGVEHGLLSGDIYQMFLAVSILSMAATPFIIGMAPRIADAMLRLPLPQKLKLGFSPVPEAKVNTMKDHLIIIGFGVNGRNVARAAHLSKIPYAIIELNPETVRSEQAKGEPIFFGDSTQEAVLQHANINSARVVVSAINDPASTRRIAEIVRRLNPKVHLIVRSRYLLEMKPLYELGANEVIPEEFETSVEIFTRVLAKYLIPKTEIEALVCEIRSDGYEMFRNISRESSTLSDLNLQLPDVEVSTLRIVEKSLFVGKSLAEIELRKAYGVTVLALRRNSQIISNPKVDLPFCKDDILFVLGAPEKIARVASLSQEPHEGKAT
ncbi:MAG: potassium transporter KefB [Candidatus Marinimicrobia bacterium]|jgi:CPA2 family monovalent cation:H+ antiporter-2|nr:potassium transporter KefB [Candidatus Neomarinimicrobiota bacterium]MBT3574935.1 potassium transporter KefB [Candidatus Neomarinimicrobiota bacterium]MBT3681341.1 potassium transporter KefB [Candidatus Neomarinimicrobiota bacterium]MBT3949868.1 potassium transporter KefB [Candidatus Neomarinimicrobiota bacterium]MBT4253103.1 potassium transporter KefB [Candidatus Neomarinimicrobiota bacterium]